MWDISIETGGRTWCDASWGSRGWIREPIHKLYRIRTGTCDYALPGGSTILRPGKIYLIPGDRPHRFGGAQGLEVDWLHLRSLCPVVSGWLATCERPISWDESAWAWWDDTWTSIPRFIATRTMAGEMRLQSLIAALIATRLEEWQDRHGVWEHLVGAVRWMETHCVRNPSLAEMAQVAGLPPTAFHKQFTRAYGHSPRQWVELRRMDIAKRLLQGGTPVQEVAERCGYTNPFHFSRVVKRVTGRSPTHLRSAQAP